MDRHRILITVKTYPTLSRKYGETVCTAGIKEDGSWIRIYPVPFRRLDEAEKYKKYDWIECDLVRSKKDPRPETWHPFDIRQLEAVGHIGTERAWRERRSIISKCRLHTNLQRLIDSAKANECSLALFKPTKITGFVSETEDPEWDDALVAEMRHNVDQGDLFTEDSWRESFKLVPKLPYSFSYRFEDDEGRQSELQVLDWEIGALYWTCLKACNGDRQEALKKVRAKYLDEFATKDLHFFLGTTQQFHFRAPNPWVIIGLLPIPYETQPELF